MVGAGTALFDEVVPLPHPTVSEVMYAVSRHYRLLPIEMISQRRARSVAHPRQVAMYLSKRLTPLSLSSIGKLFGDRDHTTVIYGCAQVARRMEADASIRAEVESLEREITGEE